MLTLLGLVCDVVADYIAGNRGGGVHDDFEVVYWAGHRYDGKVLSWDAAWGGHLRGAWVG